MKNYTLTVADVLDNLGVLADAYEKVSAGTSPTGNYFFAVNAADAAASLKAARKLILELPTWIPVEERLPDHHGTVVCRTQDRQLQFGRVMTACAYNGGDRTETYHWRGYPDCPLAVTHWSPLPEPPEVK